MVDSRWALMSRPTPCYDRERDEDHLPFRLDGVLDFAPSGAKVIPCMFVSLLVVAQSLRLTSKSNQPGAATGAKVALQQAGNDAAVTLANPTVAVLVEHAPGVSLLSSQ